VACQSRKRAGGGRRPPRRRVEGARHGAARTRTRERRRRAAHGGDSRTAAQRRRDRFGTRCAGQDHRADRSRPSLDRAAARVRVIVGSRQEGEAFMSIDTDRFRTLLLDERERIERAIANLREDHPGRLDDEVEENSTRMLAAIDASLQRLDDGTYGTCSACNREIAEQRLEAYPWASLCIDCKREAERR